MPNIITLEHMNSNIFYQLPKAFMHNPKYMFMKSDTKIAYALLRDLLSLSVKNGWVNNLNQPFIRISREKLMIRLQCAKQKMTQIMKELKEHELIEEKPLGQGNTNIIYVCMPEDLKDVIYDEGELLEKLNEEELKEVGVFEVFENQTSNQTVENTKVFENQTSKSLKIKRLKARISNLKKNENQTHIYNNISKTNYSDTNDNNNNVVVEDNKEKSGHINRIKEEWNCYYQKQIPDSTLAMFISLLNRYDIEMIVLLIDLSLNATTNVNGYIKGIVGNWMRDGINNLDDYFNTLE